MLNGNGISIAIVNPNANFQPRENLCFEISWNFEGKRIPKYLELNLGWILEGQKEQDSMSHCAERFSVVELSGSREFEIVLPSGPLNYTGKLFSIKWLLEVYSNDLRYYANLPLAF